MTRASMGRILHPTTFFMNGVLVCPGCGTMWWGSVGECHCGAAVILLPSRRGRWIDPTRRAYLVAHDGTAHVLEPGAHEAVPVAPGGWPPIEDADPETAFQDVTT